jgi:hypothetical protein
MGLARLRRCLQQRWQQTSTNQVRACTPCRSLLPKNDLSAALSFGFALLFGREVFTLSVFEDGDYCGSNLFDGFELLAFEPKNFSD